MGNGVMFKALLWISCLMLSSQVMASDAMKLAKRKGCLSCHSIVQSGVGPAWSDVAARYRGEDEASKKLVASILYGSMGRWGGRPMRGQAKKIDRNQAEIIAGFILKIE